MSLLVLADQAAVFYDIFSDPTVLKVGGWGGGGGWYGWLVGWGGVGG
jgi:hypothetical protein